VLVSCVCSTICDLRPLSLSLCVCVCVRASDACWLVCAAQSAIFGPPLSLSLYVCGGVCVCVCVCVRVMHVG